MAFKPLTRAPLKAALLVAALLPTSIIADISAWRDPRALAVQRRIYVDGGNLFNGTYQDGQFLSAERIKPPGGMLYQIDLCKNFNVSGVNSVNEDFDLMVNKTDYTNDPDYAYYVSGGMFSDDFEVYTFGGLQIGNETASGITHVEAYQQTALQQGNWIEGPTPDWDKDSNVAAASRSLALGAWTSAPSEQKSWWFGGMRAANFGPIAYESRDGLATAANTSTNVLLQFDLSSDDDMSMKNISVPTNLAPRSEGALIWLPYNDQGILLAFGGVAVPGDTSSGISQNSSVDYSNSWMTNIVVHDVASGGWTVQQTTVQSTPGMSNPSQRASFCTVVATAPDQRSHHIYVYGGYAGEYETTEQQVAYDDVWVLSIPAFRWTQVSPGTDNHRRQNHVCAKLNPTQMLSIGGVTEYGLDLINNTAFDVFDLTNLVWSSETNSEFVANSSTEYTIPSTISGSFDVTAVPTDLDANVTQWLTTAYAKNIQTYYGVCETSNASNGTAGTDKKEGSTGMPTWAKAVIAVVAVLLVVVAGALLWFCCFRKRRGSETDDTKRNSIFRWVQPAPPKSVTTADSDGTVIATPVTGYFENKGDQHTNTYEMESNIPSPSYNSFGHGSPHVVSYSGATSPFMGTVEADAQNRFEIMDSQPRDGQSLRQHFMYPRSFSGDQITSMRSDTISNGSEVAGPSRHYGNITPYELAHDRSNENLAPPPTDMVLGEAHQKNGSSHSLGVGAEQVHSPAAMTPVAPITRREVGSAGSPDGSAADKSGHSRNMSSMSDNLPNLPSPGPEEDRRRSQLISTLPDMTSGPNSPAQAPTQAPKKSVYKENLDA